MTDDQLINDIIGTMTKYGYNCDKQTLPFYIVSVLIDCEELNERMKAIEKLTDMSLPPPSMKKALEILNS